MERPKSVIYVPYWIKGIFERANRPLSELLQYSIAKEVLSVTEQANLVNLNNRRLHDAQFDPNTGLPKTSTSEWYLGAKSIEEVWRKSVQNISTADNSVALATLENATSMSYTESTISEVNARLFTEESALAQYKAPFITYDVECDVILVVIYPGYFNVANYATVKYGLLVAIVQVLYVYNTYASVCKTPYFRKYLESLSGK